MQKIRTSTGREFAVRWCGVSTIDNTLRFAITETTVAVVLSVFMSANETEKLTYFFDEIETEYVGYTVFTGVDIKPNGQIIVSLMRNA